MSENVRISEGGGHVLSVVRISETDSGAIRETKKRWKARVARIREGVGRAKPKGKNAVNIHERKAKAKAKAKPVYRRVKPKLTLTERLDAADARLGLKDGEPTQLDARLDEIDKDYLG